MEQQQKKERDHRLDFWRGIGVLGVIVLHTVFHSGGGYTTDWFRTIFMVVDIPLFLFCSGWGGVIGKRI